MTDKEPFDVESSGPEDLRRDLLVADLERDEEVRARDDLRRVRQRLDRVRLGRAHRRAPARPGRSRLGSSVPRRQWSTRTRRRNCPFRPA